MDVRCERCQTEYEVEDASVSDLGTEVQCSDCGHLFTVKRSAPPAPVGALPVAADEKPGATWKIVGMHGQTHEVRDLTELHKWIIEKRVSRSDQISVDGQAWQPLGSMPDLVPFFDIVDSAERARVLEASPRLVPLQPPLLLAPRRPEPAAEVKPRPSASAQVARASSADSLGAMPQAADIGETEMLSGKRAGGRLAMKVGLMVAVAAAIGYGGIRWQRSHLKPSVISAPAENAEAVADPKPMPTATAPTAVANAADPESDADDGSRPVVEPLGDKPEPQSAGAHGYAALGRRDYPEAIAAFKQALIENSVNRTAIFGLAEAYRGNGEKLHALRTYRRYINVAPFGPDAGSARYHIRTLEKKR
jgi:predicted Zn finger-like uncharacterized protein